MAGLDGASFGGFFAAVFGGPELRLAAELINRTSDRGKAAVQIVLPMVNPPARKTVSKAISQGGYG